MLERHFRSFTAIDRIRGLWLEPQIERYAQWLDEQHTSNATVRQHIRALAHSNDFVLARGVTQLEELPGHVDAFVQRWKAEHGGWCKSAQDIAAVVAQSRVPVERMLCVVLPGYTRSINQPPMAFAVSAPGFFTFLVNEKGLQQTTLRQYAYTLHLFEAFLARASVPLAEVTPVCITELLNERAKTLHKAGMLRSATTLRVFLATRDGIAHKRQYPGTTLPVDPRGGECRKTEAVRGQRVQLQAYQTRLVGSVIMISTEICPLTAKHGPARGPCPGSKSRVLDGGPCTCACHSWQALQTPLRR